MRKILFTLLCVLLLTSCALDNSVRTGMVSFTADRSRGVSAYIEYPALLDKTWTLQATKTDNGATTGEGTYEDVVLTDSFGPFAVGTWIFTLTSSDGKISGSVNTRIKAGNNSVAITVRSTENKGTLSVEGCDFLISKAGQVLYVDLYVDEERVNAPWATSQLTSEDGDYYVLPTVTVQLTEGIHAVRLYYGTDAGGFSSESVSIRIVNGMTTHFTIGEQEGNLAITVSFDVVEALVH